MDAVLSNNLMLPKSELSSSVLDNLRRTLTFESKFKDREKTPAFTENAKYLGVPRYYNHGIENVNVVDQRSIGTPIELKCTVSPRDYQVRLIEDLHESYDSNSDSAIVSAGTGSGKTYVSINTICKLNTTALIIVPKIDLMKQWKDALLKFTNIREQDIGFIQGADCEYVGKKVMIGMVHTLCKDKFPLEFKNYFGFVVTDELHRCGSYTFSKTQGMFTSKYRLGVSATVARQDGMDIVFRLHLGRNEITLKNNTQPIPKVLVFKYAKSSGVVPRYAASQATYKRAALLNLLAVNADRCDKICSMAVQLAEGRQVVILSERKKMLALMKKILIDRYNQSPDSVGVYIGETPQKEKDRVTKNCRIILASQQMLSEGSDIPTLRALILSTPITSVVQPVGRIRRIREGVRDPIVIDVVDTNYIECVRWHKKRLVEYKDMKCVIKTL